MRAVLFAACLTGCALEEELSSFVVELDQCQASSSGTVGGVNANWVGCRAHFSGSPSNVLTMQFVTPGTTGSFIAPGPGWLTISVSVDSFEHTTLSIDNRDATVLPTNVSPTSAAVYYFDKNGRKSFASGSLRVGRNTVYTALYQVVFDASLDDVTVNVNSLALVPTKLGGSIQLAPAGAGGGAGGSQASCAALTNQCVEGGQAACYCAAACECYNAGDATCEMQNLQSAMQLGTSCSY